MGSASAPSPSTSEAATILCGYWGAHKRTHPHFGNCDRKSRCVFPVPRASSAWSLRRGRVLAMTRTVPIPTVRIVATRVIVTHLSSASVPPTAIPPLGQCVRCAARTPALAQDGTPTVIARDQFRPSARRAFAAMSAATSWPARYFSGAARLQRAASANSAGALASNSLRSARRTVPPSGRHARLHRRLLRSDSTARR